MKIEIENITITKSQNLFKDFSCKFEKGFNLITGKSGIGKTTLVRALLGFEQIEKGNILINQLELNEKNINEIRNSISWIPQNLKQYSGLILSDFLNNLKLSISSIKSDLNYFNIEYADKDLAEFSTGELQRIFLAIAKNTNKQILIADEPSSALDSKNKAKLIEYFISYTGLIICVTHDSELIKMADNILNLEMI
jgi:ABC-type bacteriocin/lantibiotic exporter with double-glycine peptidase domain